MEMNVYLRKTLDWMFTSGLHIALVVVLTVAALKATKALSRRLVDIISKQKQEAEFQKRTQTLGSIVRHVLTGVILIVAFITALKEFGIEIGPLLAAAGIVGLAVGFAAQSLVKDVISGFFILLEDQIREGDVVQIAGQGGLVERINLKTTTLRDLSGNVHYVPNGQINVVTNMTKTYSRYVFDISVAYREDVDEVIEILKEIDEELRSDPDYRSDILEPMEILGLDRFAESGVIIRARTTTAPIKQWRVGREFNRRLKRRFDERSIEIPFPHMTLYMGQKKAGPAPPLSVIGEGK